MGCCRGRRRVARQLITGPDYCKEIEEGGARFRVYPLNTTAGLKLTADLTVNGHQLKIDLLDFLQKVNCNGATIRWISSQIPYIARAVELEPATFARYAGSGIQLNTLVKNSREIVKSHHHG